MSSIAAGYARIYIMQKRQKERIQRMKKEQKVGKGETSSIVADQDINVNARFGRIKQVHPENFPATASSTGPVELEAAGHAGIYVQMRHREKMERMRVQKARKEESSSNAADQYISVTIQCGGNKNVQLRHSSAPAST